MGARSQLDGGGGGGEGGGGGGGGGGGRVCGRSRVNRLMEEKTGEKGRSSACKH